MPTFVLSKNARFTRTLYYCLIISTLGDVTGNGVACFGESVKDIFQSMRTYQQAIYFHEHFADCLEWLEPDWQLAENYIEHIMKN